MADYVADVYADPTPPAAGSSICDRVDTGSWSPGNILGSLYCTVAVPLGVAGSTADAVSGHASDAVDHAADVAGKNAGKAFLSGGVGLGLGLGVSALALAGLGFVLYDQTVGKHKLGYWL